MYEYKITKRYQVKPTDVQIEGASSNKPKLPYTAVREKALLMVVL